MTMYKLIVSPGNYKDCMTPDIAADCIFRGIKKAFKKLMINDSIMFPEIVLKPICDGGIGLTNTFVKATGGVLGPILQVQGPLPNTQVEAQYGIIGEEDTIVFESATAAGLHLLKDEERDPRLTSTYGVGEIILKLARKGYKKFIIGTGDSATNDGGFGLAAALGYSFFDQNGQQISVQKCNGQNLKKIHTINSDKVDIGILSSLSIDVICNLTSILCTSEQALGTSMKYSKQKLSSKKQKDQNLLNEVCQELEEGLKHFSTILLKYLKKDRNTCFREGTGGAGGLGFGLHTLLNARLVSHFKAVKQYLRLDNILNKNDIFITGEGRLDANSVGKSVGVWSNFAQNKNVQVWTLPGGVDENFFQSSMETLTNVVHQACLEPKPFNEIRINAPKWLELSAERTMKNFLSAQAHNGIVNND